MVRMITRAIVRRISKNYSRCISTHPLHKNLQLKLAMAQHEKYIQALQELGLEVIILRALDDFPDSCFIEDTAIIHNSKAIITNMGVLSRRGECESITDILDQYYYLKHIQPPGTIEGGDVVHFKDKLLSGISQRTNSEGVNQTGSFLNVTIDTITDPAIVHLKSYISHLDDQTVLTTKNYSGNKALTPFTKIIVPQSEEYASNVLSINGTIIMAQGFPKTKKLLQENDFDVVTLATSEIQKCDGALTCLSLLF